MSDAEIGGGCKEPQNEQPSDGVWETEFGEELTSKFTDDPEFNKDRIRFCSGSFCESALSEEELNEFGDYAQNTMLEIADAIKDDLAFLDNKKPLEKRKRQFVQFACSHAHNLIIPVLKEKEPNAVGEFIAKSIVSCGNGVFKIPCLTFTKDTELMAMPEVLAANCGKNEPACLKFIKQYFLDTVDID